MMMKNMSDQDDDSLINDKLKSRKMWIGSVVLVMLIVAMATGFFGQGRSSSLSDHKSNLVLKKNGYGDGTLASSREIKLPHGVVSDVYGGKKVKDHEYPYFVAIRNQQYPDNFGIICGGILFRSDYVLTAAHCLRHHLDEDDYEEVGEITVIAGLSTVSAEWIQDDNVQVRAAKYMIKHPDYDWGTGGDDIALIQVEWAFELNDLYVKKASLARSYTKYPKKGTRVVLLGLGPTGVDAAGEPVYPQYLMRGYSNVLDFAECSDEYAEALDGNRDFCMVDNYKKFEICKGDSGSPILDAANTVIGITSKGNRDCDGPALGVGVFIPTYEDWIKETREAIEDSRAVGGAGDPGPSEPVEPPK